MSDLIALPLAPRRQLIFLNGGCSAHAETAGRIELGSSGTAERKGERRSPSFDEVLPHVVLELLRMRQFLDEMFDRVLPETEEVGSRNRVRVCPVADMVRRPHDHRPRTRRGASNDGLVWRVCCCDLELGAIATVEDFAVVHNLCTGVDGGEIAPATRH